MKNKLRKGLCILLLFLMVISISTGVYARDNFAYAAGIQYNLDNLIPWIDDFDAYDDCYNAMVAYQNAGYNVAGHTNPSKETLWTNLYATVQFFVGHGSTQFITFEDSGIVLGSDLTTDISIKGNQTLEDVQFVGTESVHWDADTILVTYSCCDGAGTNGVIADRSLVRATCEEGADVTVGFTNTVHPMYMDDWTDRYNQQLGAGVGVYDATRYANSFSYLLGNEKDNVVFAQIDPNLKIGKYGNSSKNSLNPRIETFNDIKQSKANYIKIQDVTASNVNLAKDKSMDERNILSDNSQNLVASTYNIDHAIKNVYNNFNKENYIIEKHTSSAINVNTNEVIHQSTYYDYKLKIGDFLTDAAFTVLVEDNKIEAIYDNNVDIEKQEELLKNSANMKISVDDVTLSDIDNKAIKNIEEKYNDKVSITDKDYTYYYDIENDKKYIIGSYETELQIDNNVATAIDNYKYEIK